MIPGATCERMYEEVSIEGVTTDTRAVTAGNLFVPLVGDRFNGHDFTKQAIEKGAVASFWQEDQENPPSDIPLIFVPDTLEALQQLAASYRQQLGLKVVGITGSNGKTSTKDLVAAVLGTTYSVHKTQGNYNNHIGLPLTILQLKEETQVAVLEMGMSGFNEIELLSQIAKPDAAVVTNIGEAHMQELGSRAGIAKAKLEIVEGLSPDGLFVYQGDEPLLQDGVKNVTLPQHVVTFGSQHSNDLYPISIEQKAEGTFFTINTCKTDAMFIPVLGKHNVFNSLAAIAIGRFFGLSDTKIKEGLASLQMTAMRMEIKQGRNNVTIINDAYNASPTSMRAAIHSLEELDGYQRRIMILGDMLELGDEEVAYHREVGRALNPEKIQYVWTYGQLGKHIAEGALERYESENVRSYEEKEELIEAIQQFVQSKDVVLVKASRGMRLEDVVNALL